MNSGRHDLLEARGASGEGEIQLGARLPLRIEVIVGIRRNEPQNLRLTVGKLQNEGSSFKVYSK